MLVDLTSERPPPIWKLGLVGLAICGLLGGGLYARSAQQTYEVGADGCYLRRPATALTLFSVDVSDPLAAPNRQRVTAALHDAIEGLPEGGRLIIAPLGSDPAAEPLAVFNECAPVKPDQIDSLTRGGRNLREARPSFEARARAALDDIEAAAPARSSPIAERIAAQVTFPPFVRNVDGPLSFYLMSDGLQNTPEVSIYRGDSALPPPPPGVLVGWSAHLVQTNNRRDFALQTPALREGWRDWLTVGGARHVTVEAVGVPLSRGAATMPAS